MGKRPLLWGTGGPGDGDADSCPLCSPPTDRARTHTCARAHPCVHTTHSHTLTPRRASSCAHSRMLAHTVTTCTHITHTSTPSHASHALIHPRWHLAPLPCKMSPSHPEPTSPPHKHRPSPQVGPGASPGQAPRKPAPPLRPDSRPTHHPVLSQGLWSRRRGALSPGGHRGEGLLPTRSAWPASGGLLIPLHGSGVGDESDVWPSWATGVPLGPHWGRRLLPRDLAGHTDGIQLRPVGSHDHSTPTGRGPPQGSPPGTAGGPCMEPGGGAPGPGLRVAPAPPAARPVQGGNRVPSEGVAQHCTQSRGEACKAWGLGRTRATAQGSTCPQPGWGPAGLDDGALLILEGGPGGGPGQQQLLLVDQTVQQVLLAVVVVDFQEGQDGDGQPGQPRGPEAELQGRRARQRVARSRGHCRGRPPTPQGQTGWGRHPPASGSPLGPKPRPCLGNTAHPRPGGVPGTGGGTGPTRLQAELVSSVREPLPIARTN